MRGKNVLSAKQVVPGEYSVVFKNNVRTCAYIATLGDPGSVLKPPTGEIGVAGLMVDVRGVFVETFDSTGVESSRPFQLQAVC